MKRLILATKLLALNPSAATRLTATQLAATRLTAPYLTAPCLTVWIFLWAALFGVAIPTSSYAQVAEICANGIDDDGDTLIDCDDPDCTFQLFSDSSYGNSWSLDVALGDLDGDGDLDAWVANGGETIANCVWINQGGDQGGIPGTYADSGQALGNSEATDVALGDLDGDGDLDAWVTNYFGQANRVWINQVSCEETPFIRGDVNADGGIDFSDAVTTLDYLFTGGSIGCEKAADSNDDGATNIVDGIALLGYLFSGTGDLPMPFPTCGIDPTKDTLECETITVCP